MRKLIEIENLNVSLNDREIYRNLSFDITEGSRYMITGKNGSGKSLLLELIFGGYSVDLCNRYKGLKVSGHIWDENHNDLLNPKTERVISYVSQNEEFHNNATFLSEGKSACRGIGIDFDETEFDELLERFDLLRRKKDKIKNSVSGGEGKLIHLITRIQKIKATNILLLDEPLNHLAFQNSRRFNDIIEERKIKNPNLTILMVSHCRAISFVDYIINYDAESGMMNIKKYIPYNCFGKDECEH